MGETEYSTHILGCRPPVRPLAERLHDPRSEHEFNCALEEDRELHPWDYETDEDTENYRMADELGLEGYDWRGRLPDAPGRVP